jgi:hypothetical protein
MQDDSENAKVSGNRQKAKKSTGRKNTSSTRYNARKHGLLSVGVTELDNAEGYRDILSRLREAPLTVLEEFARERIALNMTRLRRASRLEAEYITSILNPPIEGKGGLDFSDILLQYSIQGYQFQSIAPASIPS